MENQLKNIKEEEFMVLCSHCKKYYDRNKYKKCMNCLKNLDDIKLINDAETPIKMALVIKEYFNKSDFKYLSAEIIDEEGKLFLKLHDKLNKSVERKYDLHKQEDIDIVKNMYSYVINPEKRDLLKLISDKNYKVLKFINNPIYRESIFDSESNELRIKNCIKRNCKKIIKKVFLEDNK